MQSFLTSGTRDSSASAIPPSRIEVMDAPPGLTPTVLDGFCALLPLEEPGFPDELAQTLETARVGGCSGDTDLARVDIVEDTLGKIGRRCGQQSAYGRGVASLLFAQRLSTTTGAGFIDLGTLASWFLANSPQHAALARSGSEGAGAVRDVLGTALALLEWADVIEVDRSAPIYRVRRMYAEPRTVSGPEMARRIHKRLKAKFPGVKFAVCIPPSRNASRNLHIAWGGDPHPAAVDAVVTCFSGMPADPRPVWTRPYSPNRFHHLLHANGQPECLGANKRFRIIRVRDIPEGAEFVQFSLDHVQTHQMETGLLDSRADNTTGRILGTQ